MANIFSELGYSFGLPGLGISQPFGTPFDVTRTPGNVASNPTMPPSTSQPWSGNGYVPSSNSYNVNPTAPASSGSYNVNPGQSLPYTGGQANRNATTGGSSGSGSYAPPGMTPDQYQQDLQEKQRRQDELQNMLRNDISSGWDNYLGSLDDILNTGLDTQRGAQEDIANSQYGQGVNALDLQKTQGEQQLNRQTTEVENNQTKTLRDLSSNLSNAFQAGNIYLGSRGAGDSSAANQYSFALSKVGNKQRGDVMNKTADIKSQIADRMTNLSNLYNSGVNQLTAAKDQQISQIASWFSNAQNQIRQQIAQGGLGKSQDLNSLTRSILDQGIAQMNQVNAQYQQNLSGLQTWAANNSNDINSLKSNLAQVSQYAPQMPGYTPIGGLSVDSSGNVNLPMGAGAFGGSNDNNEKKSIFG